MKKYGGEIVANLIVIAVVGHDEIESGGFSSLANL